MPFSSVGSIILCSGTTFTVSPQSVGNLILMEVITFSQSVYCTGISGGGCTWQQIGPVYAGGDVTPAAGSFSAVMFAGKVTATGSATATLSLNGTAPTIRGAGHEFSSSAGAWTFDVQGVVDTGGGTASFPSLTPAGAGELYFGYAIDQFNGTNGSTTGYTYGQDAHGNNWLYNPNCTSSAQAPTTGDSENIFGLAVLVRSVSALSLFSPVGGWQFIEPATGNTALNFADAGDLVLAVILSSPSTVWCTGISGGGVGTWTQIGTVVQGTANNWAGVIFEGTVTSPGAATCTLTFNGSPTSEHSRFQEFAVPAAGWQLDTWGAIDNTGTADWASLNASSSGEVYYGYATNRGNSIAGSQSGFAYEIDGDANGISYNYNCGPGSIQAVWGDTGQAFGLMVLIKEGVTPVTPGSGLLMASFP